MNDDDTKVLDAERRLGDAVPWLITIPVFDHGWEEKLSAVTAIVYAKSIEDAERVAHNFALVAVRDFAAWSDILHDHPDLATYSFENTKSALEENGFHLGYPIVEKFGDAYVIPESDDAI